MSSLAIEDLSVAVGTFRLREVDLAVGAGETLVLLGPNGAGKSVTLETIAGFHRPAAGRIRIAGRDVTRLPPERRRVSLLFQNFGLFPHLTVARNVAVAARVRRAASAAASPGRPRDPAALLAWLDIAHLASRHPPELSPGEKQRAALARALAADPDLFLFDEPFSALDAPTREQLRDELRAFLRKTAIPTVFVTHDHGEALALADRIAVMREGTILQSGPAAAVVRRPESRFAATFLGIENILDGRIAGRIGDRLAVAMAGQTFEAAAASTMVPGETALLCIRAEDVRLGPSPEPQGTANRFLARIIAIADRGVLSRVALDCGCRLEACLMTRQVAEFGLAPGTAVAVAIDPAAIHVIAR